MARQPVTKKTGAPAYEWTADIEEELFRRIGEGGAVRTICKDKHMPSWDTVRKRLIADEGFAAQYARAREVQADTIFDEILEIADTPLVGKKTKTTANGVEVQEGDMIEHRRLQVDARKWMAGKLRPKVYGDKLDIEHKGGVTVVLESDAERL